MGMLSEFKKFALRGNVMDMAVGIIIGGAFGTVVKSLVQQVDVSSFTSWTVMAVSTLKSSVRLKCVGIGICMPLAETLTLLFVAAPVLRLAFVTPSSAPVVSL